MDNFVLYTRPSPCVISDTNVLWRHLPTGDTQVVIEVVLQNTPLG